MELRLDIINELGWCRVELGAGGRNYKLGADSFEIVRSRLARALSVPFHKENAQTEWVTSLSEEHCTVLAESTSNGVELQFQNAEGHKFYRGMLSVDEVEEWRQTLAQEV